MVARPSDLPGAPLRVLFVNDTARNGGPGRALYSILKFVDRQAIRRTLMLPRPGVISEMFDAAGLVDEIVFEPNLIENAFEPWDRAVSREDLEAPRWLKGIRLAGNIGRATYGFGKLVKYIRQSRFDLIYCNGTNACFAGAALAKASGVPALWHVHYTSVPKAVELLHDRLAALPAVGGIVCVSKPAAALFPQLSAKTEVIHNLLDTDEYARHAVKPVLRDELGLGSDVVIFGSHGRVLPRKGYVEFIHGAERALAELTEDEREKVRFVVVGDTPEDLRPDHLAECRTLVAARGLGKHVHFLGFRADVRPYLADFDVTVVPSVYPDPLPLSVIEGMAMATPVIAFDVGGVAEMLADGETGVLVPGTPPDVPALAREMVRYLRDPSLRQKQGVRARARILERFGPQQAKAFEAAMFLAANKPLPREV